MLSDTRFAGLKPLPAILLLFPCLFAAFWVLFFPIRNLEPDDWAYFHTMHIFSRGRIVVQPGELPGFTGGESPGPRHIPAWLMGNHGLIFEKSPGHAFLLALFHGIRLERLVNPLLVLLSAGLFAALLRKPLGGIRLPGIAALLFLTNPTIMIMSWRAFMSDVSSAALVTIGMLALIRAEHDPSRRTYILAGNLWGFAVIFRYTNLMLLITLPLYYAATGFREGRSLRSAFARFREPGLWLILAGAAFPLLLQGVYNQATTGSPFIVGYSYQMRADGIPQFSFSYLGRNLLDEFPSLVLGFPLLILYPLGIAALFRKSPRSASVSLLVTLTFFGLYLFNAWARTDHFVFTARFYLPALPGLALGAAAALDIWPSKTAAHVCIAFLVAASFLFTGDFIRRYGLAENPSPRMGIIRQQAGPLRSPEMRMPGERGPRFRPQGPSDRMPGPEEEFRGMEPPEQ
jgi:hypothetical protein